MPRPSESSSDSSSSAELNPLLNPVLGEHMGRWAEVYFTSPPEKRDAAVLDLLHELQSGNRHTQSRNANENRRETKNWPGAARNAVAAERETLTMIEEASVKCSSCGHNNPALHRFCGGCGAPLGGATAVESTAAVANGNAEAEGGQEQRREPAIRETSVDEIRARLDSQRREFEDSIAHPQELSLFRSFREQDAGDDEWNEDPPRRRFYLFAVLAILVAGAIYMAWRSGQLSAQRGPDTQRASSEAKAPAVDRDPVERGAPPGKAEVPAVTRPAVKQPAVKQEEKTEPARETADRGAKAIQRISSSKVVDPSPAPILADNGGEELTVAERYLNGTNGQRRDSAEAAKWLWKSISRHNGPATLLLADLYLKGDGVSKNCDQARVLLDIAGRKGVPGADMRLRNLQAFGCQ